jgi:predicted PurR-regulated permease PerM
MTPPGTAVFIRHMLIALGLVALALLLWRIAYALLLTFGGVLFAVFLREGAHKVSRWTRLGVRWSLGLVVLTLLALLAGIVALIGPAIANEFGQLSETLTKGFDRVREYLEQTALGRQLLSTLADGQQGGNLLGAAVRILRGATDAVIALLLVLFAGIYFAASPRVYAEGAVALLPKRRQARGREVLDAVHNALWLWLIGQFVQMLVVGVLTAAGLYLIGVPLSLALGLITGLLDFVPFLGPFVAAVPVLLVALTVDTQTALYAGLLFLGIQQIEGQVLTPLVQRWAVALPPVLVIVSAIAFTLLFGIIGAIFATPLLVVVMVCVKMLYMEDALGEQVEVPGTTASRQ